LKFESSLNITDDDPKNYYSSSPCHVPAIGINITTTGVHLVFLELYPQNVDHSTIAFQRYLISLIVNNEHKDWSILNAELQTRFEQEANFRLFTLTHEEFDLVLVHLQTFIRYNSSIASSFTLNIALTGEQTNEYESKISSRLNKINLNFDIIQHRAESYMIGLDFFLRQKNVNDDFIEIINHKHKNIKQNKHQLYPYILIHAESASTFFYVVHSPSKYSVIASNNLCYKTYWNLMKLLQPGFDSKCDEQM
jgi:pantothenate kinase